MDYFLFINNMLSIVSGLIYCAGMCSALRMKSNAAFWIANIVLTVVIGWEKVLGIYTGSVAVGSLFVMAVVPPLLIGDEPLVNRLAKGVIGTVLFLGSAVFSVIPLLLIGNFGDRQDLMESLSFAQALLSYLMYWPLLALVMAGFCKVCRRISPAESDATLSPFAGFLATGCYTVCLALGVFQNSVGYNDVAYSAAMATLFALYIAACAYVLWRHSSYRKALENLRSQELLKTHLTAVQEGYAKVLALQDRLHRFRHDLANHLQAVQAMDELGEKQQAQAHLKQLAESLAHQRASELDENANDGGDEASQASNCSASGVDGGVEEEAAGADVFQVTPAKRIDRIAASAIIMFSQLLLVLAAYCQAIASGESWFTPAWALSSAALCISVDLVLILNMHRKELKISESLVALPRDAMEKTIQEFENGFARQKRMASGLLEQLEDKVRKAAASLSESSASEVREALQDSIDLVDSAGMSLCENVVADAVAKMEMTRCAEAGLRLDCELQIPAELPLSQTQLAALIFNLVDNATKGSLAALKGTVGKQAPCDDKAWVSLKARPHNGSLVIAVRNPCDPKLRGIIKPQNVHRYQQGAHGWGVSIVNDIAAGANGSALFEAEDGVFTATVIVPLA